MEDALPLPGADGSVTSHDGTVIGFRRVGEGEAVVLVHGGGQSSHNLMKLATLLGRVFQVYVPDRRGRGMSGPYREDHGLRVEIEDLEALLAVTGARRVFGLSIGALIALEASRAGAPIAKLALYEPPLSFDHVNQTAWVPRYERELAAGRLAAATVTVLKGTADRNALRLVPRWLLVAPARWELRKPPATGAISLVELISTMHFEARTVADAAGPLERFAPLSSELLLLGGERSGANLRAASAGLSRVLSRARRVTFSGVGHLAADNGGRPDLVAKELEAFFA